LNHTIFTTPSQKLEGRPRGQGLWPFADSWRLDSGRSNRVLRSFFESFDPASTVILTLVDGLGYCIKYLTLFTFLLKTTPEYDTIIGIIGTGCPMPPRQGDGAQKPFSLSSGTRFLRFSKYPVCARVLAGRVLDGALPMGQHSVFIRSICADEYETIGGVG
jgi:hypothetical protein